MTTAAVRTIYRKCENHELEVLPTTELTDTQVYLQETTTIFSFLLN